MREEEENSLVFQKQQGESRFEKKTAQKEVKGAEVAEELVCFAREFS